jgi:hypothetical protein
MNCTGNINKILNLGIFKDNFLELFFTFLNKKYMFEK